MRTIVYLSFLILLASRGNAVVFRTPNLSEVALHWNKNEGIVHRPSLGIYLIVEPDRKRIAERLVPCDTFSFSIAPGYSREARCGMHAYIYKKSFFNDLFYGISLTPIYSAAQPLVTIYHTDSKANVIVDFNKFLNRAVGKYSRQTSSRHGCVGFFNLNGSWIVQPQFEWARGFAGNRAVVYKDREWGAIDFDGTIRVPLKYQRITDLYKGKWMAAMDWNDKVSIIDKNGSHVEGTCHSTFEIPRWYPLCEVEGYTSEETKARNQVLKREMKRVRHFSCGLAAVQRKDDGLWGFVDEESKFVIPPMYEKVSDFCFDFAWVKHEDSEWITIGTDGKEKEVSEELRENVAKEFFVRPKVVWP